jgi:hypothetical protein
MRIAISPACIAASTVGVCKYARRNVHKAADPGSVRSPLVRLHCWDADVVRAQPVTIHACIQSTFYTTPVPQCPHAAQCRSTAAQCYSAAACCRSPTCGVAPSFPTCGVMLTYHLQRNAQVRRYARGASPASQVRWQCNTDWRSPSAAVCNAQPAVYQCSAARPAVLGCCRPLSRGCGPANAQLPLTNVLFLSIRWDPAIENVARDARVRLRRVLRRRLQG